MRRGDSGGEAAASRTRPEGFGTALAVSAGLLKRGRVLRVHRKPSRTRPEGFGAALVVSAGLRERGRIVRVHRKPRRIYAAGR